MTNSGPPMVTVFFPCFHSTSMWMIESGRLMPFCISRQTSLYGGRINSTLSTIGWLISRS